MHQVVDAIWNPIQSSFFANQPIIENRALDLIEKEGKNAAIEFLTRYTNNSGQDAVSKAWETGDYIWTTFDGLW
jgi:hypothetical protein